MLLEFQLMFLFRFYLLFINYICYNLKFLQKSYFKIEIELIVLHHVLNHCFCLLMKLYVLFCYSKFRIYLNFHFVY